MLIRRPQGVYAEFGIAFLRFLKLVMFTRYSAELVRFLARMSRRHPDKMAEALALGVGGYSLIIERDELERVFQR